jgi:hypothetical protein
VMIWPSWTALLGAGGACGDSRPFFQITKGHLE